MKTMLSRPGIKTLIRAVLMLAIFSGVLYYNGLPPKNAPPFSQVQAFRLESLSGPRIDSLNMHKPTVLVFWATWCGPCKVELSRIQRLVANGTIARDSVVGVDVGEDKTLVAQAVSERGYTFDVGLDSSRGLANQYKVNVTPTILFRNADGTIAWRTAGISPTLELRILNFLGSHS